MEHDPSDPAPEVRSALQRQVGGNHYKSMPVQPMLFNVVNGIPWAEGEVIKYVARWKSKGGVNDLKKAHHILEFLIEFHEGRLSMEELVTAIEAVQAAA